MFAQIDFNETRDNLLWNHLEMVACLLPEKPLPAADLQRWQASAAAIVDAVYARLPRTSAMKEERKRVELAVRHIVPRLSLNEFRSRDRFDFVVRCAIAHHRLPETARKAREARIESVINEVIPETSLRTLIADVLEGVRQVAVLIPDPIVSSHLRSNVWQELVTTVGQRKLPTQPLLGVLVPLVRALPFPDSAAQARWLSTVVKVYRTRPPADRPAFMALLQRLIETGHVDWLVEVNDQMVQHMTTYAVFGSDEADAVCRVLAAWLDEPSPDAQREVLNLEIQGLVNLETASAVQMAQDVLDAVIAGVDLGAAFVEKVQQYLAGQQALIDAAQAASGPIDTLQVARHALSNLAPAPDASADVDPVHAWSVGRLLRWIEGPLAGRAIDRGAIRQRRREERRPAARAGSTTNAAARVAAASTAADDEETDRIIDAALQTTADFLWRDLDDLLNLAGELDLPDPDLEDARRSREAMQHLAQSVDGVDAARCGGELSRAESAIDQLRQRIRGAQADDRLRARFARALAEALGREPLVRGKRHGGVINFPLPRSAWAWVNGAFHAQWLFQYRELLVDGRQVPLAADEALALYVTGDSRSGYAFDISVHLWQRRAGHTGQACLDVAGQRTMNRTDWFDTLIPCAVLHVPLAN